MNKVFIAFAPACLFVFFGSAQEGRALSETILTRRFEVVPNVSVKVKTIEGKLHAVSNAEGDFRFTFSRESLSVSFSGNGFAPGTRIFAAGADTENLQIKISCVIAAVNESVAIKDDTLTPDSDTRNDTIYKNFLFGRDDRLIQTLNAAINAGQHEGGGKSSEIRRFGFSFDHGGVNGGLKIPVGSV